MGLSVQLGLVLALLTALASIVGFLYKHRGAIGAPPVQWRRPVASTAALFRNRWWIIGIVVAMAGWVFHVAALALAPITLVQSVIAGGLVLLTVIAERLFGLRVTRREWVGVALTAAGLAFLAATLGEAGDSSYGEYRPGTLIAFVGLLALASVPLMIGAGRSRRHAGTLLAAAAGLQWGASDVTIKAATGDLAELGLLVLLTPEAAAITALSFLGLAVSARSLQLGEAVGVIAVTSAAANLSTIASGLVVFGEPLPDSDVGAALRLLAFGLVVLAAALTPGPVDLARRDADAAAARAAAA